MTSLELALLYLIAAVLSVVVCRLLQLPAMLGYLLAGLVMGPNAFSLAKDSSAVLHLAEFGVVFLMFVIGLEFNLPKLRSMKKMVFGLGLGQVLFTILGALSVNFVLALLLKSLHLPWGLSWQGALALGASWAMSSTAIVVKLMSDRAELSSAHGLRVMGVLLFQDLAVVPLLVLIPALGGMDEENIWLVLSMAMLKASLLVGFLLWGGQGLIHRWLKMVARRKSEELFMLNILLITLGLSWLTDMAGLSLAMGAFLAGMLISETEFKNKVEEDIKPFHDVLLGLFFITIGMKLDWVVLREHWALVLILTLVPVLAKALLVAGLTRLHGAPSGVALRTGIYLAQAGEFGFVLLTLVLESQLITPKWISPILAAMVLSMIATPFLILHADRLVYKWVPSEWLMQSVQLTGIAQRVINDAHHVIICGYGRSGKNLAKFLANEHIPFLALDPDADKQQEGRDAGHRVELGDASQISTLMSAGLVRAAAVVVSYQDTGFALKILALVKEHAPLVPVIVRTHDEEDLELLRSAGAADVIPEVLEGSLRLASQTLAHLGVSIKSNIDSTTWRSKPAPGQA